jgi:glucokinase
VASVAASEAGSGAQLPDVAIAIDLGGTQSRVAAITREPRLLARVATPTNAGSSPDAIIGHLAEIVGAVRAKVPSHRVLGLGVAAPGPLDPSSGVVYRAPNLPGWTDVPLGPALRRLTGLQTFVGNDANLAALAEARCGAGRGARDLVYLTVSTGIGSGLVVDGHLIVGARGAGGEAGHMAISLDGPLCGCGNRGCLEAYASGAGLVRRARGAMAAGRPSALVERGDALDAEDIGAAAEAGDPLARELLADAGRALGVGVRNLLHLLNPSVVVIGGGASRIGPRLWEPMRQVLDADALEIYRAGLRVVPAELGDDSGLLGAALLVFEATP